MVTSVGAFNIEGVDKVIEELTLAIERFDQKEFKLFFDYLVPERKSITI